MTGQARGARWLFLSIVLGLSTALASCDKQNAPATVATGRTTAELDATVAQLEATVKQLETTVAALKASQAKWVLWQTSETLSVSIGIAGPSQPKPVDAYATKDACLQSGEEAVLRVLQRGEGQQVDALSFRYGNQFVTYRVTMRCLPDSIDMRGPKQ